MLTYVNAGEIATRELIEKADSDIEYYLKG